MVDDAISRAFNTGPRRLDREWREEHEARGNQVTLIEAAKILGTSPDNLRGAIKRGSLKAKKIGRDWTVTPAEVERYRRESRRQSPSKSPDES